MSYFARISALGLLEYGLPDVGWELAPDNKASVTPL